MYIPLTLILFATVSPVGRRHAVPIVRATSDTTQQHSLHFRYFPQQSATLPEPTDEPKPARVRLGSPGTKLTEDSRSVAVPANRKFVYSCRDDFFYVEQYRIGQGRRLYPLTPFKVAAHSHPGNISLHPNGRFAYVSCTHGAICQYRMGRTGQLVPLTPTQVYVSSDPSPLLFDASRRFACVVSDGPDNRGHIVSVFRVQADGTLKLVRAIPSAYIDDGVSSITVRGKNVFAGK